MRKKFLMVVAALSLVAAACGGGDDEPELSSAGTDDASTASDGDADGGDDAAPDEGDDDGEAMTGDSGSDWCDAVRADADDGLDVNLIGLSPDEIEETFTNNVEVVERWESMAPPEIEDQVTTMADAFRQLVTLAEAADWNLAVLASDPAFADTFDTPELEAAADDIDAYATDVCGVDLGVDLDGGGGAPAADATPPSGGDDLASQFLAQFGLPPSFLTPDQLDCVNGELEVAFPDGVPADLAVNEEAIELFSDIGDACTLGLP